VIASLDVSPPLPLGVGHFVDDLAEQFGDLAVRLRVALAHEQLGRDGQVAGLGEAPRHVGNVFVYAKDLRDHQHHRQVALARRLGAVHRHLEVADHHGHLAHR
jgi:hypothetical protein